MGDTNYMNAYVNLAVETVHNYLNDILQLRTQLKLLNDLVSDRDQVISALKEEQDTLRRDYEQHKNDGDEMQKLRENASVWEHQYNVISNKVAHMDTLTNQYNDLKKQFVEKNDEAAKLSVELANVRQELTNKTSEFETVSSELETVKRKLDRLNKKDKKIETLPKKDINKEDTKSSAVPTLLTKPIVKVEDTKEADDDF